MKIAKEKIHKPKFTDEQLSVRYETGYFCFLLLVLAYLVNSFFSNLVYKWAEDYIQFTIIILVVITYFVVSLIVKGAFFKPTVALELEDLRSKLFGVVSIIFGAIWFFVRLNSGVFDDFKFTKNGMLNPDISELFFTMFFISFGIACFVRYFKLKKGN